MPKRTRFSNDLLILAIIFFIRNSPPAPDGGVETAILTGNYYGLLFPLTLPTVSPSGVRGLFLESGLLHTSDTSQFRTQYVKLQIQLSKIKVRFSIRLTVRRQDRG